LITSQHQLPLRVELSGADNFLLAVSLEGLLRSASIVSPGFETAINHASRTKSKPLARLLSSSNLRGF